jgi:hypothetical protein
MHGAIGVSHCEIVVIRRFLHARQSQDRTRKDETTLRSRQETLQYVVKIIIRSKIAASSHKYAHRRSPYLIISSYANPSHPNHRNNQLTNLSLPAI